MTLVAAIPHVNFETGLKPAVIGTARRRLPMLDFFRGLALLIMFVDHVPGSVAQYFTPAAVGFIDAADAFIFISGYVAGFVYTRMMEARGAAAVFVKCGRRCLQIYAAHCATLCAAYGILYVFDRAALLQPGAAGPRVSAIFLLQWTPGLFQVLTLYLILAAIAPVFVLMLRSAGMAAVAAPGAVYLLAHLPAVRAFTAGVFDSWCFVDPLSWQLLFCLGVTAGWRHLQTGRPIFRRSNSMLAAAASIVAAVALWKLTRFVLRTDFLGLATASGLAGTLLPVPGKADLPPLRLADFGIVAYLAAHTVAALWAKMPGWITASLILFGRHSLPLFCLHLVLVQLSALVLEPVEKSAVLMRVAVTVAGTVILLAAAKALDTFSGLRRKAPLGYRLR